MPDSAALVDSTALCKALGIKSKSTLGKHIKRGMPVAKKKRHAGHAQHLFDLDDARQWYAENVRADSEKLAHVAASGAKTQKAQPLPVPEHAQHDAPAATGWSQTLERCRTTERFAYGKWVQAVNAGDLPAAASHYRTWEKSIDTLRKVEKDSAGIERQRGEVISLREAERIYMLAHGAVEGELRAFAKRLSQTVARKRKVSECRKVIDDEVDQALRHITEALVALRKEGEQ
jgi:hypothetical protein